ncbi:MAG: hypothetical protein ACLFV0_00890 [Nitriliruptoraceae bacterium]
MTTRRSASFVALIAMLVAVLVPVTAFANQDADDHLSEDTEVREGNEEGSEGSEDTDETTEPEVAEGTPGTEAIGAVEVTEAVPDETTDHEQPEVGESSISATATMTARVVKEWYDNTGEEVDDPQLLGTLDATFEVELRQGDPDAESWTHTRDNTTLVSSTTVTTSGATPTFVTFGIDGPVESYIIYGREISTDMGDSGCTHTFPRLPRDGDFGWRSLSESSDNRFSNGIDCREQLPFELTKIWLDEQGEETDPPSDLGGWNVGAWEPDDTGGDGFGDQIVRLEGPEPSTFTATATVASGTEYTVVEDDLPDGWYALPADDCEDFWRDDNDYGNVASQQLSSYPNFGTDDWWTVSGNTTHVVCNQRELPEITVVKDWIGDEEGFGTATFDIRFWSDRSAGSMSRGLGLSPDDAPPASSLVASATGVTSGTPVPIPVDRNPDFITIHENVDGASCDWGPAGVEDTFTLDDTSSFKSLQASQAPQGDWVEDLSNWNGTSFTVTFTNEVDCPSTSTSVPSSASVDVDKVWEVDGVVVDAPADAAPSFEVSLTNSLGIPVGGSPRTVADGGTASFPGLTAGSTYDVSVEEDADSLPDASVFADEGQTCEFAGSTVEVSSATVTAPGSVTATVTNAYECSAVLGEIEVSVDVAVDKVWQTPDGDPIDVPDTVSAVFMVEVFEAGSDMATATITDVAAGEVVTFDGLVDGDEYVVAWTETAAPEVFELGDETCILAHDGSTTSGEQRVTAGDLDALSFDAVNVYDCEGPEVLDELEVIASEAEIARTGFDAGTLLTLGLLLSMIGLMALRLGRRREQTTAT